jgi:hypothetical protein
MSWFVIVMRFMQRRIVLAQEASIDHWRARRDRIGSPDQMCGPMEKSPADRSTWNKMMWWRTRHKDWGLEA